MSIITCSASMPRSMYRRAAQEGDRTLGPSGEQQFGAGQTRVVVHSDMQELPAGAAAERTPPAASSALPTRPTPSQARPDWLPSPAARPQPRLPPSAGAASDTAATTAHAARPCPRPSSATSGARPSGSRPADAPPRPSSSPPSPSAPPVAPFRANSASANALRQHQTLGSPACNGVFFNTSLAGDGSYPISRSAPSWSTQLDLLRDRLVRWCGSPRLLQQDRAQGADRGRGRLLRVRRHQGQACQSDSRGRVQWGQGVRRGVVHLGQTR